MAATQLKIGLNTQDAEDPNWEVPLDAGFVECDARLRLQGAGDPNGSVASKYIGQMYRDTTNNHLWFATTELDDAGTDVWVRQAEDKAFVLTGAGKPDGAPPVVAAFVGQRFFDTNYEDWWTCTDEPTDLWKPDEAQGTIKMWNGLPATIPKGWAFADGATVDTYVTPNLKSRFIVGYDAGDVDYDAIEAGSAGVKNQVLAENQMPSHEHVSGHGKQAGHTARYGLASGLSAASSFSSPQTDTVGFKTSTVGGATAVENRPPFYTLTYIVKL